METARASMRSIGEEKISKLLIAYSLPVYLSHLAGTIYNIISRVFVGNSDGVVGLAAISVYFPFSMAQMAFAFLFGMGGSLYSAIKVGEGDDESANRALNASLQMILALGILIVVIGVVFAGRLMTLFGASEEVLPSAVAYCRIMLAGCVFQMIHVGITNYMRVEGKTLLAMIAVIISPVTNIIAACIFVLVLKWGIRGAALATILGQILSAGFIIAHFSGNKGMFRINLNIFRIDVRLSLEIMYLGLSSFVVQICQSMMSTTLNLITRVYGGDIAISGMGVVTTLQMFILQPVSSVNMGSQALIGFNFGSKRYDRVREIMKKGVMATTVILIVEYVIMRAFSIQLVSIFAEGNDELIAFSSRALTTFLFMVPLIPLQMQGAGFLQAIRKPIHSIILSLSRQALILIPALLILPRFFGLDGVLYSGPVADFISLGITLPIFLRHMRRLGQNNAVEKC